MLGNNFRLSREETKALSRFRTDGSTPSADNDGIEHTDFADSVLSTAEVTRSESSCLRSNYRSLKHVAATSNVCERLFSRAKLVARDQQQH